MFNKKFWIKYGFRLAHMLGVIFLGGKIMLGYLFPCGEPLSKAEKITSAVAGVILMTKKNLKDHRKLWIALSHFKLFLCIILN